jgi:mannose-1-phosphate guanylyltransferase/mannose-6-phosphate isomerase
LTIKPLVAVILSGGVGSRLWPISREEFPKPFIKLPDGQSLLQRTFERVLALPNICGVLVVTNQNYYSLSREECGELENSHIKFDYLLEPFGRNTAAAIAAAAIVIAKKFGDDAIMLVLPADHIVKDQLSFNLAVNNAKSIAEKGWLVTFGLEPARPETGYGYIKRGDVLENGYQVAKFVEKPDLDKAINFINSGNYLWNLGIFCFSTNVIRLSMLEHCPELWRRVLAALAGSSFNKSPVLIDAKLFEGVQDISIDCAIMERSNNVAVVVGGFDWEDVGSWRALMELMPADTDGNRLKSEALIIDSTNCFIQAESKIVAVIGVNDLIVIDTPDALLISQRERSQDVKAIVDNLKKISHVSTRQHHKVHRPWGTYTLLGEENGFKIKRVEVHPGASLSLQSHQFRSEHWVVVSGEALIINNDQEILIKKNESTYIPAGSLHRLCNPGKLTCVIVEVQVGSYLGEDDIERFDDLYGRIRNL